MKKHSEIKKRFVAVFTAFSVFLLAAIGEADVFAEGKNSVIASQEGYFKIAEEGQLELYLDSSNADFYVKNLADGAVWESAVSNFSDDEIAEGIYKTELASLISLNYYDEEGAKDTLNSYSSSILDDNFEIKKIDNGFRIDFNLGEGIAEIPIEVKLEKNSLSVKMLTSELKVKKGYNERCPYIL